MASKPEKAVETQETSSVVGYDAAAYEWETVHAEAPDQVVFETPGDCYIGLYIGYEIIYPDPEKDPEKFFIQLKFVDPDGAKVINAGYDLRRAYVSITYDTDGRPEVKEVIPPQTVTRNTYMKDVDVDQASEMRSFRVDQAKPRNAGNPVS